MDAAHDHGVLHTIRRLWEEGRVRFWDHAEERMEERGIDVLDVQQVILHGRISEHRKTRHASRWKLTGKAVDGKLLAVVVEIQGDLLVIAVMRTRRG